MSSAKEEGFRTVPEIRAGSSATATMQGEYPYKAHVVETFRQLCAYNLST